MLKKLIYRLTYPKRRKAFTLKLLNKLPRKFRNGSYVATIELRDIQFFKGNILRHSLLCCIVQVEVRLRKRKNGNKNLQAWTQERKCLLKELLTEQYTKKLKYIGVHALEVTLELV